MAADVSSVGELSGVGFEDVVCQLIWVLTPVAPDSKASVPGYHDNLLKVKVANIREVVDASRR